MKNKPLRFAETIRFMVLVLAITAWPLYKAQAQAPDTCRLADLSLGAITITSVSGNTFQYLFEVKNAGRDTLFLNRMLFQTYVSINGVQRNHPAGGSIFGTYAPALAPGQSYTAYWYYNPTVPEDLTQFPYLIITAAASHGYTVPECRIANNTAYQHIGCVRGELQASNIVITRANATTLNYTVDLKNTGWDSLMLHQYYFKAYFSKNDSIDSSDKPAGSAVLVDAPTLQKDETYTQSLSYNITADDTIRKYPYLLVEVRPLTGVRPECYTYNNFTSKYIGCNLAELVLKNLVYTNVTSTGFDYSFDVVNTGWDSLYLSRLLFQTWLSADSLYNPGDIGAGGAIFGFDAPTLGKDERYTQYGDFHRSPFPTLPPYSYFLVEIRIFNSRMPECRTDNNRIYKMLPAPSAPPIVDPEDTGEFEIAQTGGYITASAAGPFHYSLFALNNGFIATKILSGKASKGLAAISTSDLAPGMYVLDLTNGKSSYSYKFIIKE